MRRPVKHGFIPQKEAVSTSHACGTLAAMRRALVKMLLALSSDVVYT